MPEHIHYDDDPGDTVARQWLFRTKLGRSTLRIATHSPSDLVERMLLRAIRAGWLLRDAADVDSAMEAMGFDKAGDGDRADEAYKCEEARCTVLCDCITGSTNACQSCNRPDACPHGDYDRADEPERKGDRPMTFSTPEDGDQGQRYKIQAETNIGNVLIVGWSDDPTSFTEAVRLHPGLKRRIVIDRADEAHDKEGGR